MGVTTAAFIAYELSPCTITSEPPNSRIVLLYLRGILRSFKKCMCGGQINKWAIYMDVLSLHDEIRTALLYGERARAMYDIDSRCANMLYQLWGRGWW